MGKRGRTDTNMILDATAGNRTMYVTKQADNIIYIDMEKRLEVKPTIFCDHHHTPFPDHTFDTIIYDPPHSWFEGDFYYTFPDKKSLKEMYPSARDSAPRYYGWDKIKNKSHLYHHIFDANKEFYRILKPDGLLWLKWNEMKVTLKSLMQVFEMWNVLLRIYVKAPSQTAGTKQTYWVAFIKKRMMKQSTLV